MNKTLLLGATATALILGTLATTYLYTKRYSLLAMALRDGSSFWYSSFIDVPCGKNDATRKVYTVDGLGAFCVESGNYDTIKYELREGRIWEKELHPYFARYIKPGDTVVDVGAHIGAHTVALSSLVGPRGRVIAFEPQVKIFQEFLVTLRLNNIKNVMPEFVALGDHPAFVEMDLPASQNEGHTAIGSGGNIVELRTLDSYKLDSVSFIKIDVEGAELGVLKGAAQTIARSKPVLLVELGGGYTYAEAPEPIRRHIEEASDYIRSLGYTLEPISFDDYLALPISEQRE